MLYYKNRISQALQFFQDIHYSGRILRMQAHGRLVQNIYDSADPGVQGRRKLQPPCLSPGQSPRLSVQGKVSQAGTDEPAYFCLQILDINTSQGGLVLFHLSCQPG